ncbi:hypothetical protein CYMTET_53310 [Cymbomonas tetramitiformis]|uniref:Uncharacterized protein n=1 Tax=Cymbomonas tetramitiformis TaxID=36881 RepID=A0AAE0EQ64_9CHLO|nr:hypothetical protein CYMTET_53310 [Cymbomonas tetramitiformis]
MDPGDITVPPGFDPSDLVPPVRPGDLYPPGFHPDLLVPPGLTTPPFEDDLVTEEEVRAYLSTLNSKEALNLLNSTTLITDFCKDNEYFLTVIAAGDLGTSQAVDFLQDLKASINSSCAFMNSAFSTSFVV